MENQNEIYEINEKPYGRKGIEEMLERMKSLDDRPSKSEKANDEF